MSLEVPSHVHFISQGAQLCSRVKGAQVLYCWLYWLPSPSSLTEWEIGLLGGGLRGQCFVNYDPTSYGVGSPRST